MSTTAAATPAPSGRKPNIIGIAVGGSVGGAAIIIAAAYLARSNVFDKSIKGEGTVPDFSTDATLNNPFYDNPIKYRESEIYDPTLECRIPPLP